MRANSYPKMNKARNENKKLKKKNLNTISDEIFRHQGRSEKNTEVNVTS